RASELLPCSPPDALPTSGAGVQNRLQLLRLDLLRAVAPDAPALSQGLQRLIHSKAILSRLLEMALLYGESPGCASIRGISPPVPDRKSTRLNSSHVSISY